AHPPHCDKRRAKPHLAATRHLFWKPDCIAFLLPLTLPVYEILHESVCERSPELGLWFAVSARFSFTPVGKLPPASARCWPNECLVSSFCSRWTIRWGTGISIPASRSAAFTATATSLCTKGNRATSSVVKPSTKTSASSPNCLSTASGGGFSVTFGWAAAVLTSNPITCSGFSP